MTDIKKIVQKIELLQSGKTLFMDHNILGKYKVNMNPQRNRIITEAIDAKAKRHVELCKVKTKEGICYNTDQSIAATIEKFIIFDLGAWTVEIEPKKVELREVVVSEGLYERI